MTNPLVSRSSKDDRKNRKIAIKEKYDDYTQG